MEIMHVTAKSNLDVLPVVSKALGMLGKKVGIVTTIQHLHKMKEVQAFLEKNGKTAEVFGQVLGCQGPRVKEVDSVLYVGSGEFHPQGVLLRNDALQEVIVADPYADKVSNITRKDLEPYLKRRKAALVRFYNADTVGVLLSAKSGQNFIEKHNLFTEAKKVEKKFPDKQFYYFACNTLHFQELEHFPFVNVWLNCMCPRMEDDAEQFRMGVINVQAVRDAG